MALQDDKQKHISNWQASGLSQAAYCQARGLNAKTFGNWFSVPKRVLSDIRRGALFPIRMLP